MLNVLCIIIYISCPRKRIKNRGMLYNLLRGQRIYSFCQIYFLREEGVPEADINM